MDERMKYAVAAAQWATDVLLWATEPRAQDDGGPHAPPPPPPDPGLGD